MTSFQRGARALLLASLILAVLFTNWSPVFAQPAPAIRGMAMGGPSLQDIARFESAECMFDPFPGLIEGTNMECGYLTVPEEWDNPSGPTIRLAVVILKAQSENPAPDPLVMMQGGPGGSTIDLYTQVLPVTGRLWADRDIILFDQRGTLLSEPALTCPEYMDMAIETLDDDLTDEQIRDLINTVMTECRDRLVEEGVNLSAFDSRENAADVPALVRALGYEEYNLYGVSYGTLLAQHVMRFNPEGLRTVILDSVVPPGVDWFVRAPQTQNRSYEELFAACAADTDCNEAYPNLREVLYETVDRLNAEPAYVSLTDAETGLTHRALLDGDTVLSAVFQMMYSTDLLPMVPSIIYDARANRFDVLTRILSLLVFDRTMSYGMYYSVNCSEDGDVEESDLDLSGLPEQVAALNDDSVAGFLEVCDIWDVEALDSVIDAPVQSDVPTLLLSGHFDPITPPEYAEIAAETLPNSYNVVFPWGGHGAATSGECQDSVILQFINNPNQAPDTACVAEYGSVRLLTPNAIVKLPAIARLLTAEGSSLIELLVYGLALLFLLTALVVYPLVWLVRLMRKPAPAVVPAATPGYAGEFDPVAALRPVDVPKPALYRFAPWISWFNAAALLLFTAIVAGVLFSLIAANDLRWLVGLPGSTRPAFVLPPLALLLTLLMLAGALVAWVRRAGSVWGRIYLTLITLAAIVCLIILGVWGMLSGILA